MISGTLRAIVSKRDMDLALAVYQLTPDGEYFTLGYSVWRASYARDETRRRLLTPGKAVPIPVRGMPLVSRVLQPGSRLVVQLTVNKNRFAQVNYGTGKDVSDESIADAKAPLEVSWLNDSRIVVPIRRGAALRTD